MSAESLPKTESDLLPFGRYRRSLFDRGLAAALAVVVVVLGIMNDLTEQKGFWLVLIPLLALLVGVIWFVPVTTVTEQGISLLRRKLIPWDNVTEARLVGPRENTIRLYLNDGRQATLYGVPTAKIAGIRSILANAPAD